MKYVSLEESRAGSKSEHPKPRKRTDPAPRASDETSDDSTNPGGGSPASSPEED